MAHRGRTSFSGRSLTLEAIHSSIRAAVDDDDDAAAAGCLVATTDTRIETDIETTETTTTGSTPLHEALNEYILSSRPKEGDDVRRLASLVVRLARLCETDRDAWKVFVLVAFHRRYHGRAPAAKNEKKKESTTITEENGGEGAEDTQEAANGNHDCNGDGERMVFYVTILTLDRLSSGLVDANADPNPNNLPGAAALAMTKIATEVGGTRDVNALVEHLTFGFLVDLGHATLEIQEGRARGRRGGGANGEAEGGGRSFAARSVVPALDAALLCIPGGHGGTSPSGPRTMGGACLLDAALGIAAGLLDEDLARCTVAGGDVAADRTGFMSTVHVTLPHCDRGSSDGASRQRKLANSVAEALVWGRTRAMTRSKGGDERFSAAVENFRKRRGDEASLRMMQTSTRKKRKVLNDAARDMGHMLCSSYLQDQSSVEFGRVRRGKAGDVDMLRRLASKRGDSRVLAMIASRQMDPAKANPAESVGALVGGWRDTREEVADGSVEELEARLQAQTVRVTLEKLRAAAAGRGRDDNARRVLVAAVGPVRGDAVCVILVAAALQPHSGLILGDEEVDVSTDDAVLDALNAVIARDRPAPPDASATKSAQDVLEETLGDFDDAIIVSSSDVEVDEHFLDKLKAEGKTLRVHATERLDAATSPPVVDLDEEVGEGLRAGRPVSVAVVLDCTGSMGGEIEGCKAGAMRAIEAFGDLAPVRRVSFMGYWDPPGSQGDPDVRSTGFLDPGSKGSLDDIQEFVNTRLPCTGGGDEPEDVPAALERLIDDMEGAGLSSDGGDGGGTHFVLWIADAGYRRKEDERVRRLFGRLNKLGVVIVMCPVRENDYGTCRTLVEVASGAFPGRFVKCGGVSALGSIASIVTGAIRASLFKQSNVASVTASVGETMEALLQLCAFRGDHGEMRRVGELTELPDEVVDARPEDEPGSGDGEEDGMKEEEGAPEAVDAPDEPSGRARTVTPTFVPSNEFRVTNVDRIYLQISRLPLVCRQAVEAAFGGRPLRDVVASDVAARMVRDAVPIGELREAGYPAAIVDKVRGMMGGHGTLRQQ